MSGSTGRETAPVDDAKRVAVVHDLNHGLEMRRRHVLRQQCVGGMSADESAAYERDLCQQLAAIPR